MRFALLEKLFVFRRMHQSKHLCELIFIEQVCIHITGIAVEIIECQIRIKRLLCELHHLLVFLQNGLKRTHNRLQLLAVNAQLLTRNIDRFQLLNKCDFMLGQKRNRVSLLSQTRGSAHSVNVRFCIGRNIEVNHPVNIAEIESSRRHFGAQQNGATRQSLEHLVHFHAFCLSHFRVQARHRCIRPQFDEDAPRKLDLTQRREKDDHFVVDVRLNKRPQQIVLVLQRRDHVGLHQLLWQSTSVRSVDGQKHRSSQRDFGQFHNVDGQRGAE
mmetsp:Transcript_66855/g.106306  ORF Transcript_66855/g.106306 Transcript_66855/m.106306 type:complete len:271 (+) Transcript_66855:477-1289(+)